MVVEYGFQKYTICKMYEMVIKIRIVWAKVIGGKG
ncbi:hypothetical protein Desdi_0465 [Desulfitobacterium dichloroeliminans LMG P-21439]|uniref:Uncharacterized protein n=1 Tax=Desulfitobacterium dichloroeliminans (strain LMG P-21439 / DCA1) TaxID=871963 RepID=L0F514_DESDL|nr:hypothetical protein Desdi_0465 [Desulfitobacterium dichloroeliminans LMG P-21439]